jgi:hypothetical protein
MATATEVRAWAVPEGIATSRGKLRAEVIAQWDRDHPDDLYEANPPRDGFTGNAPDYPADDFDAMFPDVGEGDGLGDTGETPPTRPKSSRSRTGTGGSAGGVRSLFRRGSSKAKGKKTPPRVSTEDVWGSLWRAGAKLLTPLPPLQRTLRMQAPVAGMLMDDVTRTTFIDPLLQPLARLATQGKTIQALAGPPVFVSAICLEGSRAMAEEREPNPLFMAVATEGLRSSLMAWMDVAGPKFEIAMQREREFEEKYGQSVDDMMALIFAPPVTDAEAAAAEDEAIRRAQGVL